MAKKLNRNFGYLLFYQGKLVFVKVSRPEDSEVIFSVFESNCLFFELSIHLKLEAPRKVLYPRNNKRACRLLHAIPIMLNEIHKMKNDFSFYGFRKDYSKVKFCYLSKVQLLQ